jgi:hypothetical protein
MSVKIAAQASFNASGGTVSISGSAMTTVSEGAGVSISGPMVKLG